MSNAIIVTGDDVALPVTLRKDAQTFTINPAATIQAAVVSVDKATTLIAATTVLEANTGSDWANSLIVVEFDSATTGAITQYTKAYLEIEVNDGGKLTWFTTIEISQGTI